MQKPVTVVVINSLSYTGTTWLNLVLGSHPRAFALGPPDRVWNLRRTGWDDACRIHGADCPFWPSFFKSYRRDDNFFVQLADFAGRDVIVINNPIPDGAGKELNHPRLLVRNIQVIRDGRAIVASYHRHVPEKSFLDGVRDWLTPALSAVTSGMSGFRFDPDDPDLLCVRYEEVLSRQREFLPRFSRYVGIEYDERALRFFEWDHHIAAGNHGTLSMIKAAQGIAAGSSRDSAFYQEQFAKLQRSAEDSFLDERWRQELSERDLFVFDYFCGQTNEFFGYERDRFSVSQVQQFSRELGLALAEDRSSLPGAWSAPPPAVGLSRQLRPAWLRRRGLHLTPRQVRTLGGLCAAVMVLLVLVVAVVTGILVG